MISKNHPNSTWSCSIEYALSRCVWSWCFVGEGFSPTFAWVVLIRLRCIVDDRWRTYRWVTSIRTCSLFILYISNKNYSHILGLNHVGCQLPVVQVVVQLTISWRKHEFLEYILAFDTFMNVMFSMISRALNTSNPSFLAKTSESFISWTKGVFVLTL